MQWQREARDRKRQSDFSGNGRCACRWQTRLWRGRCDCRQQDSRRDAGCQKREISQVNRGAGGRRGEQIAEAVTFISAVSRQLTKRNKARDIRSSQRPAAVHAGNALPTVLRQRHGQVPGHLHPGGCQCQQQARHTRARAQPPAAACHGASGNRRGSHRKEKARVIKPGDYR
jgi:hypothetical protein